MSDIGRSKIHATVAYLMNRKSDREAEDSKKVNLSPVPLKLPSKPREKKAN
jgi:hypothetical protein